MIVAGFASRQDLHAAVQALHASGAALAVETYTPTPLTEDGPPATSSPLPLLMLIAFVLAGGGMFGLQLYADMVAYPLDIGGKPDNSWPAFIPNAFEAGVMVAMIVGVFGYFALNGMPRYYRPVDRAAALRRASRDAWFLSVEHGDPAMLRPLLLAHRPIALEQVAS